MALEFDSRCGTAQDEDKLQLYIPPPEQTRPNSDTFDQGLFPEAMDEDVEVKSTAETWIPIMKKFYGTNNWPSMTVIVPGKNLNN